MGKSSRLLGCGAVILLLLLTLAAVVGFYSLATSGWDKLKELDPNVAAAVIAVSGSILVATAGVVWNNRHSRIRQIQEAHRPEKVKLYAIFFDIVAQTATSNLDAKARESISTPNLIPKLLEFKRGLLVWGSPAVIRAWMKFDGQHSGPVDQMKAMDNVLRAMRRDLGNSNWMLSSGDLIDLYIKAEERGRLR